MKIEVKLLGTPKTLCNGQQVSFPFRKAEALFYYILVVKQASRDELVNLLWAELDEDVAKKNLRNALYVLRKLFNENIFLSSQRSMVVLNYKMEWETDIDYFFNGENSGIDVYHGEFLQGILIKDAENFEQWAFQKREAFRDIYIKKLHKAIKRAIETHELSKAEAYCKLLIHTDELDEEAYRSMMQVYCINGNFNKGIEVYYKLVEVLDKELSIAPDTKTMEVFDLLLQEKSLRESLKEGLRESSNCFFYGREKELEFLKKYYSRFLKGKNTSSILVLGEAGVGKTKLTEYFLKNIVTPVFTGYCYEAEEDYLLKPWNSIFSSISKYIKEERIDIPPLWRNIVGYIFPSFYADSNTSDVNPVEKIDILKIQVAIKTIVSVLKRISETMKIIILIEDIQWADEMSLSLLRSVIQETRNQSILIIVTCRDVYTYKIDRFIADMVKDDLIRKLELTRLNRSEVYDFTEKLLPDRLNDNQKEEIYKETEGNIFFLVEYLNNFKHNNKLDTITPKMKDILKNRMINVSKEGQKILNIASIYFDRVYFHHLQKLSEKSELDLLDIMDELQNKRLLKEAVKENEVSFVFTHQKLREYIYGELSLSRRRILHKRAAALLEESLEKKKRGTELYSKLIYHFSLGGDKLNVLKYSIKDLKKYLIFSHEIFPVLSNTGVKEKNYLYLRPEEASKKLKDLERLFQEVMENEENEEILYELELSYLHMIGRFHISQGEYIKGLDIINDMLNKAYKQKDSTHILKAYRQLIYFCINTQDIQKMEEYVVKALEIAELSGEKGELGILLRLKGYLKIMQGKYRQAEEILERAIVILKILDHKNHYTLNIAACYNFIGESKRHQCQFQDAIEYYNKAISLCEENNVLRGLTIFYTNAGQGAFDSGDFEKAKRFLKEALRYYSELDFLWGRSTAKSYYSLLLVKEGQYDEALELILEAEKDGNKLKSPYELGLIYKVKAEIRVLMEKNSKLKNHFRRYLPEDIKYYCEEAINMLAGLRDCYEIERLGKLKQIE